MTSPASTLPVTLDDVREAARRIAGAVVLYVALWLLHPVITGLGIY